jgi:hypothetical protein
MKTRGVEGAAAAAESGLVQGAANMGNKLKVDDDALILIFLENGA